MEIPSSTCPNLSYFIQDKVENYIYLSLDRFKRSQYNFVCHFYELKCCMETVLILNLHNTREFISGFMLFLARVYIWLQNSKI